MAIKKDSLAALLVKVGAAEDNAKALELINADAESEVVIPETTKVFNATEYTALTTNLKNEGTKIGKELAIKDLKEKAGVEFEGKSPDKFIEAFKEHTLKEANTSVDEKVKSRDKTISELKEALGKEQTEKQAAIKRQAEVKKDFELLKLLPKDRDPRFTDQQYLTLLKSELEFTEEEGKPIVKKAGEVLKDAQFNPMPYEAVIKTQFETAKWLAAEGGAGGAGTGGVGGRGTGAGGAGTGGKLVFGSLKDLNTYLSEQNIHPGSQKATQILNEAVKANPEMDMSMA